MKAAYWIATVHVTDAEAYGRYAAAATPVILAHGGRFLVRGGTSVQLEGPTRERTVVAHFPSLAAAEACYRSEGYQAALAHARGAAERSLVIVEEA
jgi:uncharacterized protein (DUF1330 family)